MNGGSGTDPYSGALLSLVEESSGFGLASYKYVPPTSHHTTFDVLISLVFYAYIAGTSQSPPNSPDVQGEVLLTAEVNNTVRFESAIWMKDTSV